MIRCLPKGFWLLCLALFAISGWLGYLLGVKPKAASQAGTVTLDFYGLDIDGNRVGAADEHKTRLNDLRPYELTRPVGTVETLKFAPDRYDQYRDKSVTVTWLAKDKYLEFLDRLEADLVRQAPARKDFWNRQFRDYRTSAKREDKNKFDYPHHI